MAPGAPAKPDDADDAAARQPTKWVCVGGLPHRPNAGTYAVVEYASMPPLPPEAVAKFQGYVTADDVKAAPPPLYGSPTDCYIAFHGPGMFYTDSQGCVSWFCNDDGTVSAGSDAPEMVVASSLAECLARIDIENRLWFASSLNDNAARNEHVDAYERALEASADQA